LFLKTIPHTCFISASYKWFFSDKKPPHPYEKPVLLLDRLMDLLHAASDTRVQPIFGIDIPDNYLTLASSLLDTRTPNILIAPGAGGRFKCWPLDYFTDLGNRLHDANITPHYILGPAEPEWRAVIASKVQGARFPLQETTETSVFLTIALARLANASVANDSGVGHILASADQPMISMWGPTDPLKSTPNGNGVHVIDARSFGGPHMTLIPVDSVFNTVMAKMDKRICMER
jgi:ADP-heptose:LPS heptosyltransferase